MLEDAVFEFAEWARRDEVETVLLPLEPVNEVRSGPLVGLLMRRRHREAAAVEAVEPDVDDGEPCGLEDAFERAE